MVKPGLEEMERGARGRRDKGRNKRKRERMTFSLHFLLHSPFPPKRKRRIKGRERG